MAYLALVSFSNYDISMAKGEVKEINDPALVDGLLKASYIVPFEPTDSVAEEKADDKTKETKRKGKTK